MVAHIATVALNGISATSVDVQVQIIPGLPNFQIVGLPEGAVKESKERIRGAFHAMGISMPSKRIVVNLSPADITKDGSHYDVPIAIGLLAAMGTIPKDGVENCMFMGELSLDGVIQRIPGCLPAAIHASACGLNSLFAPKINSKEAAWADGINVYGVNTLQDIISHIKGTAVLQAEKPELLNVKHKNYGDFSDVKGQEIAKRAAEIAAAGGHNLLMCGCPGAGKSMIASRIPSILPDLSPKEALEVSMIHSVAGMLHEQGLINNRPFRDPHHSASAVALCGGGHKAKPGEMSLAHRGVLFLDELPEFPRQVLETLRQPIETGSITVSRANHHVTYPANFQLIAAMNPSPCGYLGHPKIKCTSSPKQIQNYRGRISGPLLDRIDLYVDVPVVDFKDLSLPSSGENSATIKNRVEKAYQIQQQRYKGTPFNNNSEVSGKMLDEIAMPCEEGQKMLQKAGEVFGLSARAYHKVLKVARTIADLAGEPKVLKPHIAEALSFRYQQID